MSPHADPISHRFYGIYQGLCWDNQDPEGRNRLRVVVPEVGTDPLDWAECCLPPNYGSALVAVSPTTTVRQASDLLPSPGSIVWLMFASGDPDRPVWIGGTP